MLGALGIVNTLSFATCTRAHARGWFTVSATGGR